MRERPVQRESAADKENGGDSKYEDFAGFHSFALCPLRG
jgi:hypothetical protein